MIMGKIITVGLAGYGRSGKKIHSEVLKDMDQFKIVAVADELPERRQNAEEKFGARTYDDYNKLIEDGGFDLFINALPSFLHTEGTIKALNAKLHAISEKPFAKNMEDFEKMVQAAKTNEKLLLPFQNHRFQPFFYKIKEILDSGILGEAIAIRTVWNSGFKRRWDWQIFKKNLGGTLFNTGPHVIDQIIDIIGEDKKPQVFCKMKFKNDYGGDAEDHCSIVLHGKDIPVIEIHMNSHLAYPNDEAYNISCTKGGLVGNAFELKWKYYNEKTAPKHKLWKWSVNYGYPYEHLDWIENEWHVPEDLKKNMVGYTLPCLLWGVEKYYENIYEVLVNGAKPICTLSQVRRQIEIMEECHRQNE